MSELQNENVEVLVPDEVETSTAVEETKNESLGAIGVTLIGLAAVGTITLGRLAYKGGKKLVDKVNEKAADMKRFKDSRNADYEDADDEFTDNLDEENESDTEEK